MLSENEQQRYARQIVLPEVGPAGQEKLRAATVFIAGAGGLGSVSSLYLAAAGVGKLVIADPDHVSLSNLNRQIIHSTKTLGWPKTRSAELRLRELNPDINVVCRQAFISSDTVDGLTQHTDIIVDATDNRATRDLLNRVCITRRIPFVFGGVDGFDGMVTTLIPGEGPCFKCLFPGDKEQDTSGILGPVPGMIASLQALEVIKLILGIGRSLAGRLLRIRGLTMTIKETAVPGNPQCPACGKIKSRTGVE